MTNKSLTLPSSQQSRAVESKEISEKNRNLFNLVPQGGEYEQTYLLRRIKLEPISITAKMRDMVLQAMAKGSRFVQIGEFTIMTNTISSIEPKKLKIRPLSGLVKQLQSNDGGEK